MRDATHSKMTNNLTPLQAYEQLLISGCTQEQLFKAIDECSNIGDLEVLLKRLEKDGHKSGILYDFIAKKIAYLRSPQPVTKASKTISASMPSVEKMEYISARHTAQKAAQAGKLIDKGWGNNGGGQPPI